MNQATFAQTDLLQSVAVPPAKGVQSDLWDQEYSVANTIPSSRRAEPAHALRELQNRGYLEGGAAIDLGCGNGRNSFFLLERGYAVTSIDYSRVALSLFNDEIMVRNIATQPDVIQWDLRNGIPSSDETADLVLDSYCLCHFTESNEYQSAMSECWKKLKSGGLFVKIHLSCDDEYYRQRMERETSFGFVSFDPANGFRKSHFSLETLQESCADEFELHDYLEVEFEDDVRGESFVRNVFAAVLRKI